MGWLRVVGSSILQVSFAKETYKRDYILQKRTIISQTANFLTYTYEVASISRLLNITGLFGKRDLLKRETTFCERDLSF